MDRTMKPEELFGQWEEGAIWSCLQGVMGEIHTNPPEEDAAVAVLGDFAFFAGKPCEKLVHFRPEIYKKRFMIMVPQNDEWAELIEKCYGEQARKVSRYAIKKEKNIFDKEKLQQAVSQLPEGYELKLLEEEEYKQCRENGWSKDLVAQFEDYQTYSELGLGVVVLKDGQIVAGASSYSRYKEGIEIEIDTCKEHRRKGLAFACGAKLILECLERNLYPSWDAQNMGSVKLAEKLGYHYSHTYTAYEVDMQNTMLVNQTEYDIIKLLGHGKGGYSYLAKKDGRQYVLKQIHHEPCDYYSFGNKIEAERNDYRRLVETGIRIPKMLDMDIPNERILKEYIDGPTIAELVENGNMKDTYLNQVQEMAEKVYSAGLNIDYFPTNFVVQDDLIYYIDYECNDYSDEWNFENWGIRYWSKTEGNGDINIERQIT